MFARTDRLLLRPGWREDAPALASALADPAVSRMLARVPAAYTLADAEQWLDLPEDTLPRLLVFLRDGGAAPRLAGGVGLQRDDRGRIELGYWVSRALWGRGIATEACRALLDMADHALGLSRLVSGHFAENLSSAAVLRKLGFTATGQTQGLYSLARNAIVPCVRYERVAAPRDAIAA